MSDELLRKVQATRKKYRFVDRSLDEMLGELVLLLETAELSDAVVVEYLEARGVTLLPWQRKKLGAE